MNVQALQAATEALKEYRAHRGVYDERDWEIERIYRAIARGKTVISVIDAIRNAGVDEHGRPRLAIWRAAAERCRCTFRRDLIEFSGPWSDKHRPISITWPAITIRASIEAIVPRIPPKVRPRSLAPYHILWEADWKDLPRDPYLLRRIGKDAWVVVAAWELTDVEMSVLRAHQVTQ